MAAMKTVIVTDKGFMHGRRWKPGDELQVPELNAQGKPLKASWFRDKPKPEPEKPKPELEKPADPPGDPDIDAMF
jgi:hypothetical protein